MKMENENVDWKLQINFSDRNLTYNHSLTHFTNNIIHFTKK